MSKFRTVAAGVVVGAGMAFLPGCAGVMAILNSSSTVLSILATLLGFVLPAV